MASLADMGSRYPGTPGNEQAQRYLVQVLGSYGAGDPAPGPHGGCSRFVSAHYGPPAVDIVLGAHFDSIADRTPGWRPAADPAPGANDNGTGVAGLLEAARILAMEAATLRRGIDVVFFNCEETGMEGSRDWVARGNGGKLMLNLDMVGFAAPGRKKLDLVRYGNSGDLLDRARAANDRYALGLQLVDRLLPADLKTWVDSTPFAMAGIPAITITESYGQPGIDYPGYPGFHRVSDTADQVSNAAQWKAATQLLLALTLELAR